MYQVRLSHTKQECTTLSFIYDMGCTSSDRALDLMLRLFITQQVAESALCFTWNLESRASQSGVEAITCFKKDWAVAAGFTCFAGFLGARATRTPPSLQAAKGG